MPRDTMIADHVPPTDGDQAAQDTTRIGRLERWREDVIAASRKVDSAEVAWEEAKAASSAAKAGFDFAVVQLRSIIADKPGESLFDGVDDAASEKPEGGES